MPHEERRVGGGGGKWRGAGGERRGAPRICHGVAIKPRRNLRLPANKSGRSVNCHDVSLCDGRVVEDILDHLFLGLKCGNEGTNNFFGGY